MRLGLRRCPASGPADARRPAAAGPRPEPSPAVTGERLAERALLVGRVATRPAVAKSRLRVVQPAALRPLPHATLTHLMLAASVVPATAGLVASAHGDLRLSWLGRRRIR